MNNKITVKHNKDIILQSIIVFIYIKGFAYKIRSYSIKLGNVMYPSRSVYCAGNVLV